MKLTTTEDDELILCYQQGFKDELNGSGSIEYPTFIKNRAYKIGANHALLGDDNRNFDNLSNEQILMIIKVLR